MPVLNLDQKQALLQSIGFPFIRKTERKIIFLGETLWFNHATRKHGSYWKCHPTFEPLDIPYNKMPTHSYYGDGSDIPADVIQHIRDVSWQCAVGFQMQRGNYNCNL